jgi:rhomboid protease GluP
MHPDAQASGPREDLIFPISYPRDFFPKGGAINYDLTGKGSLTVRWLTNGTEFSFSGRKRAFLPRGPEITLAFAEGDIADVTCDGCVVGFKTPKGVSGRKKRPFVFICENKPRALEIASLLPARLDDGTRQAIEYYQRLDKFSAGSPPGISITNTLGVLNAIVFVIMGFLGAGWIGVDDLMPYVRFGANNGAATTDGEWWRLVTSMFMHFGIFHLGVNMWALFNAGPFLEKLMGRFFYVLTYFASGVGGGFASILWNGDATWSAGASGAIFGVYGTIIGHMLRERKSLPRSVYKPILTSTVVFAGYNILNGFRPGIDNAAHVGGLLCGLAIGGLLSLPLDAGRRAKVAWRNKCLGMVLLGAIMIFGILTAPRFNYSVREELAWDDANASFPRNEADFLNLFRFKSASAPNHDNQVALRDWMKTELIPFYDKWMNEIDSLILAPERLTARRRLLLMDLLRKQRNNYQLLLDEFDVSGRMKPQRCDLDNKILKSNYIMDKLNLKRTRIH